MTTDPAALRIEFCSEWHEVAVDSSLTIGRDADLVLDENPYLHRRFVEFRNHDELWWIANVGSQISATLSDEEGRISAWLAPGARIPLVLAMTVVRFTAGPTSYEFSVHLQNPPMAAAPGPGSADTTDSTTTLGRVSLNYEQRLLVLALAEPMLRRQGSGMNELPTSQAAAVRLGWPLTKFNRKLDYVCQKLTKAGVGGLHGAVDQLANSRRARLVEYALAVRLVTFEDLKVLDDLSGE